MSEIQESRKQYNHNPSFAVRIYPNDFLFPSLITNTYHINPLPAIDNLQTVKNLTVWIQISPAILTVLIQIKKAWTSFVNVFSDCVLVLLLSEKSTPILTLYLQLTICKQFGSRSDPLF